ncbi:hypothetical protein BHM03_00045785 [Ensete ventricosum]|nr:hypothetical protein BHM03_00045785 [Ensete ventricosum]
MVAAFKKKPSHSPLSLSRSPCGGRCRSAVLLVEMTPSMDSEGRGRKGDGSTMKKRSKPQTEMGKKKKKKKVGVISWHTTPSKDQQW